jgi:hypothetical protein
MHMGFQPRPRVDASLLPAGSSRTMTNAPHTLRPHSRAHPAYCGAGGFGGLPISLNCMVLAGSDFLVAMAVGAAV